MVFPIKVLEGELPNAGETVIMFIDPIGRPMSPTSVSGAHRRHHRRAVSQAHSELICVLVGRGDTKLQVNGNLQSHRLELARSWKASNRLRWRICTNLNEL
jgi:hypothetical protein